MRGMSDMKKYIIFPNVSFSVYGGQLPILKCGSKVRLLYFDEQGNAKGGISSRLYGRMVYVC